MKITKKQRNNSIFFVIIAILLIPQTRQPIQLLLHQGLAKFSPSVEDKDDRVKLNDYEWALVDENGVSYDFQKARGKVVVINFWATWCPPCIAEMPSLEKLYNEYKDDVVILLVSNEKPSVISKFKEQNSYDFLVYASVSKQPKLFDVSSIPRTFVIDKKGTIVIDKSGAANWYSDSFRTLLETLLKAE